MGYQIIVGGTTIKNKLFEDGVRQHLTVSARVDSTNFPPNLPVSIQVKFLGSDGQWYSQTQGVPVKNRVIAFDRADFASEPGGSAAPTVGTILTGTGGYDAYVTQAAGWARSDILSRLTNAGVVYVNSHGTSTEDYKANLTYMLDSIFYWLVNGSPPANYPIDAHCSDEDEPYTLLPKRPTGWIFPGPEWRPVNYEVARQTANGSGGPPFNSTNNPPTFLLMLDTCYSASNNNFIRIMWPYLDGYGEWIINRAYTGWSGWSQVVQSTNHATECYLLLSVGYTVGLMRDKMISDNALATGQPNAFVYEIAQSGQYNQQGIWVDNWEPVLEEGHWPVWGDQYTRVRGVYTGTNVIAQYFWYL